MSEPLSAHGLTVGVPEGWEAQISRAEISLAPAAARVLGDDFAGAQLDNTVIEQDGTVVGPQGTANPVAHIANFAMPPDRGDFGSGAVEIMRRGNIFVAIVEYDPEAAATPLFAHDGPPAVTVGDFDATQMQRTRSGLVGCQRFFRVAGHAFCAYMVVPSADLDDAMAAEINQVLASLQIG